ncbi:major capsid protein [Apis mellifera associated microvirus 27]|nr:major capsid protein [Apis mellifera associated microvirus 27]
MSTALGNRYSQHSFARVPTANTPRSKFDRSFTAKDTADFDYLNPFFLEEIIPGDTINLNVKTLMRLAPQVRPYMDNAYVDFYFFFIPNRLVFEKWQALMGEQENPGDSIDFLTPVLDTNASTSFQVGTIQDKFGIPTDVSGWGAIDSNKINALPFRMYNLVFNQWFRDQNLQTSLPVPKTVGPDPLTNYVLVKGNKKHDYFTSALPFQQKGTAGTVPLVGTAPVFGNGSVVRLHPGDPATIAPRDLYGDNPSNNTFLGGAALPADVQLRFPTVDSTPAPYSMLETYFDSSFGADVGLLITQFRQAIQLQSFLEQDARGGTRYTEILKSHFNVVSPDARLQRAEFLSAATINISQHLVPQTSETGTTPQGNLSAFSTAQSGGSRIGFSKSFVEHGFVLGLFKARGEITYQQGLNRLWSRRTRYDYFWPKFQELSEQPVYKREIYMGPFGSDLFGWQERYAEYRYRPSEIRGQFRSTFAQSLDVWHLSEEFGSTPALNNAFIQSNTPIERTLAVTADYPHLLCDFWFDYKHIRPMVTYPVPVSLGRF